MMEQYTSAPENSVYQTKEDFLALQLYCSEDERPWSPSIADQLKVGFFGADHATQTDVTEVLELKKLTEIIQTLVKDMDFLKRDLEFSKNVLQADYELKVQQQALELYTRMNDRLKDLEGLHQEKIRMIRRSCRQQLADGLAVLRGSYQNYYTDKTGEDQDMSSDAKLSLRTRYHALINKLQEKEATISALKAQILEYEDSGNTTHIVYEQEEDSEKQRLEKENEDLKQEINTLQDKIESLANSLALKETLIKELGYDLGNMKDKMEKDQKTINKLITAQEQLKSEYKQDKSEAEEKLLQQKLAMEKEMEAKLNAMKQEMLLQREKDAKKVEELEQEKHSLLLEKQRKGSSPVPVKKKLPSPIVKDLSLTELDKLQKIEQQQRKQIESLKKQLDWTNRMWEKKFAILKQSLHAIKDEMFLRQTLQRQAATLHQASISYAVDASVGIIPGIIQKDVASKVGYYFPGLPLPRIGSQSVPQMETAEVHPICIPSGPGTDTFTAGESQIVSEDEEDPDEVLPLPSPLSTERPGPYNSAYELIDAQD